MSPEKLASYRIINIFRVNLVIYLEEISCFWKLTPQLEYPKSRYARNINIKTRKIKPFGWFIPNISLKCTLPSIYDYLGR